jgi:hypothetical protein
VCVFSTGKRASGNLMTIILDFLAKVPGGIDRISRNNQEELCLGPPAIKSRNKRASTVDIAGDARTSKLSSFPSSVAGIYE